MKSFGFFVNEPPHRWIGVFELHGSDELNTIAHTVAGLELSDVRKVRGNAPDSVKVGLFFPPHVYDVADCMNDSHYQKSPKSDYYRYHLERKQNRVHVLLLMSFV
jgi:hypothetical protein